MIFLDAAATTPVRREVLEAMWPYLSGDFGNPSSHHSLGEAAAAALAGARDCDGQGAELPPGRRSSSPPAARKRTTSLSRASPWPGAPRTRVLNRVAISAVEHPAVEESARYLERVHGFAVDVIPVDRFGQVTAEALAAALRPETALVSVMYANNEVGTVQPIRGCRPRRERGIPFHSDAVQAAGWLPLDTRSLAWTP